LTFRPVVSGLQAKVALDLPKFEFLLSATKDNLKQDLLSTREDIPVDSFKTGFGFPKESHPR
jgi:hypothetical protein